MLQSWCKKAFFSTEYILVNNCGTLLKKGAVELSVWIEEDVKNLSFQQNIFWSTSVEHFWKRCCRAFSLDRRGCKKSLLFNRKYFGQQLWDTFEKCAIEVSVWIEEDVQKGYFSTEYILVSSTFVDRNIFCGKESFLYLLFYPKWKLYSTFFKSVPHLLTKIYYVEKKVFLHPLLSKLKAL